MDNWIGKYVWGTMDNIWWPGVVVPAKNAGMLPPPSGHVIVYWFAAETVTLISINKLVSFTSEFQRIYSEHCEESGHRWKEAVFETLVAYSDLSRQILLPNAAAKACAAFSDPDYIGKQCVPPKVNVDLSRILLNNWILQNIERFHGFLMISRLMESTRPMCMDCHANPTIRHPVYEGGLCQDCANSLFVTKDTTCFICGKNKP